MKTWALLNHGSDATIRAVTTNKTLIWIRQTGLPLFGRLLAVGLPLALLVVLAVHQRNKWRDFKSVHNCQKVGHVSGDIMPTFGISATNGQPTMGFAIESDKVGWKCDDGVTYWR